MPGDPVDGSNGAHNPKVGPSNPILHDPLGMQALDSASFGTLHRWGVNRLVQS